MGLRVLWGKGCLGGLRVLGKGQGAGGCVECWGCWGWTGAQDAEGGVRVLGGGPRVLDGCSGCW